MACCLCFDLSSYGLQRNVNMYRYILILNIHLVVISKPVSGGAFCKVLIKKDTFFYRLGTLLAQNVLENSER